MALQGVGRHMAKASGATNSASLTASGFERNETYDPSIGVT